MEKKYTDLLSKIGETLSLDNESRQALTSIDDGYYINCSENWSNNIIKSFSDNDLINIFKGLIIAEQCYSQLCGSVTVGKLLYREIGNRNLDENLKIANWAYTTTRNGYIPFDSNGRARESCSDAYAFIQYQKESGIRHLNERDQKKKRLLIKKNEGLEKKLSQKEKEIKTLKRRLDLAKLSTTQMANEIINDDSQPVYFYYHEIETLIRDKSVDKKLLENILSKFKNKEKKEIKSLKNKLKEEIKNRIQW